MADKSDLNELEEELARLESELETLEPRDKEETGAKSKLKDLLGKLPFSGGTQEPDEGEAPGPSEVEDPPEPTDAEPPEPEPEPVEEAPPEPEPPQEPQAAPAAWSQEGSRWRRPGTRGDRDVVLRRLDAEGNVVEEAPTDDPELLAMAQPPGEADEGEGRSAFSTFIDRFRSGGEATAEGSPDPDPDPRGGDGDDEEDDGSRRVLVLVGVGLVLLAVLAAAAALLGGDGGVGGGDEAPSPAFSVQEGTIVPAGEAVTFDASATEVPGGASATYTWDFGDGATATGRTVTHAFGSAGTYNVTLEVSAGGATATTSRTVTVVTPPNPTVTVLVNGTRASTEQPILAGEPVTLEASVDEASDVTSYAWTVGGQTATGTEATVTLPDAGPAQGRLTVTYGGGLQEEVSFTLGVSAEHRFNGTLPASTTAPTQGPMHNFTSAPGGLAATALKVNLTYDTGPGGLLGGAGAEPVVNITDAAGNVVANLTGENGFAEETFTDLGSAAMGTWTAVVEQDQGGAEKTYTLRVTVVVPPRSS